MDFEYTFRPLENEHYPKTINDVIGNKKAIQELNNYLETQINLFEYVVIYGPSGSGKSLITKLCLQSLGYKPIWLSLLDNTFSDTINELSDIFRIKNNINSNYKTAIIIDDFYNVVQENEHSKFMKFLRSKKTVHVVCISDYIKHSKLVNRVNYIQTEKLSKSDMEFLCNKILISENIKIPKKSISDISTLLSDIRQMYNLIQLIKLTSNKKKLTVKYIQELIQNSNKDDFSTASDIFKSILDHDMVDRNNIHDLTFISREHVNILNIEQISKLCDYISYGDTCNECMYEVSSFYAPLNVFSTVNSNKVVQSRKKKKLTLRSDNEFRKKNIKIENRRIFDRLYKIDCGVRSDEDEGKNVT